MTSQSRLEKLAPRRISLRDSQFPAAGEWRRVAGYNASRVEDRRDQAREPRSCYHRLDSTPEEKPRPGIVPHAFPSAHGGRLLQISQKVRSMQTTATTTTCADSHQPQLHFFQSSTTAPSLSGY